MPRSAARPSTRPWRSETTCAQAAMPRRSGRKRPARRALRAQSGPRHWSRASRRSGSGVGRVRKSGRRSSGSSRSTPPLSARGVCRPTRSLTRSTRSAAVAPKKARGTWICGDGTTTWNSKRLASKSRPRRSPSSWSASGRRGTRAPRAAQMRKPHALPCRMISPSSSSKRPTCARSWPTSAKEPRRRRSGGPRCSSASRRSPRRRRHVARRLREQCNP
mmetsp:Transcript_12124/g.34746  ORF Transcript_12124/g.34746 Transcript_12124/m.34746 type:complete len:219 (+) Transcript_12124:1402-2058(+)